MEDNKEKAIRIIVNQSIKAFATGFEARHKGELKNPLGTLNLKKNNCFISVLGDDFIFYSALVRSFDSSFGKLLESLGNAIAKYTYETKNKIESYILTEQTQHISGILDKYENHILTPSIFHYKNFYTLMPKDITSFKTTHNCDNWFYDKNKKIHYLIELKSGGDLDTKKAKSEKSSLLKEYFMLKNLVTDDEKIVIKFATAYNKYGEGNAWHQSNVELFFSNEELLIGKDYWNFVCNDDKGFDIVFDEYKKSSIYIKDALTSIKKMYSIE